MEMLGWVKEIGPTGFLDIALIGFLIYLLMVWFKKTRSAFILRGFLLTAGLYLFALQFNLSMVAGLLEKFFALTLVVLVVIFQEELRHLFEQVATFSIYRDFWRRRKRGMTREEVKTLVDTVYALSADRIGALIIIKGKELVDRHLQSEIELEGRLSEPLLRSLFDPHSIGHDGAVLISENRVVSFGCHLPLSHNDAQIKGRGTRHSAALGLSELCDAFCIVVSEERGVASVARHGVLTLIKEPDELKRMLDQFYQEISPISEHGFWKGLVRENSAEKLYATILAFALWFVIVHGAKTVYATYRVPAAISNLPSGWTVSAIEPSELDVTLRGARQNFFISYFNHYGVTLDPKLRPGVQVIRIHPEDFQVPKNVSVEDYAPRQITVTIERSDTRVKDSVNGK